MSGVYLCSIYSLLHVANIQRNQVISLSVQLNSVRGLTFPAYFDPFSLWGSRNLSNPSLPACRSGGNAPLPFQLYSPHFLIFLDICNSGNRREAEVFERHFRDPAGAHLLLAIRGVRS